MNEYRGDRIMEYTDAMKHRLRRIEGQIRGVLSMMEEEKDCRDVVTQLAAIRSAVDRVIGLIVAINLESCIRDELEKGNTPEQVIKEAIDLLVKSR
jgi:DNA-binding FrmR family transcriptional regulator